MDTVLKGILNNQMVILAGVLGGFLGLLLSYRSIGKIIRMLGTSTAEISTFLSDERVEIVGKADGQTAIHSPITKTPCVLWQVVVSEKRSSGKNSHWVTVHSGTSTAPFDVYDGTGRVQVHPSRQMELLLRDDVKKSSGVFHSLDEQTQIALNELGVNTKGFLNLNRAMRVQERYIEQGDQIYLLGSLSSKNGTQVMDTESPLIVSDHSELQLLGRFAWQVFINALMGIVVGVVLSLYFTNR
jgi:hypothetical protein